MTDPRTCLLCGAVEPRGGLRLTADLDEWVCRRTADCIGRMALHERPLDPDDPPSFQTPAQTAALIDMEHDRRRRRTR